MYECLGCGHRIAGAVAACGSNRICPGRVKTELAVSPFARLNGESVVVWYEGPPGTEVYMTLTKEVARKHAEVILRLLDKEK